MTQELFNKHLRYDPNTGHLWWRVATGRKQVDRPAGTLDKRHSRIMISVEGIRTYAHRVIWSMVYGDPVPELIDHIDRDATNNRLSNLRAASKSVNALNADYGVWYDPAKRLWRMHFIRLREHYATEAEARQRRDQLLREHGVIT